MNQKVLIAILIIILLAVGAVYYILSQKSKPFEPINESSMDSGDSIIPDLKEVETVTKTQISGWKTYHNEEFRFEFQYPAELKDAPLEGGERKDQSKAWTIKDEYNNDRFNLVLYDHNLSSFEYTDHTSGGKYVFDSEKNVWRLSSDVTPTNILRNLMPVRLELPIEAYKYHGGSGFCVWDSYLIPLHNRKKLIELQYNVCGSPPPDEDIAKHKAVSSEIISSFKFLE